MDSGTSTQSPLIIFPEGSTSNNTSILPFKRGALSSLLPVMPVSLQYDCKKVHIANEVLADHVCLALFGCNFLPTFVKVNFYPTFIPTEYLWTKHADKGKTKWEIYAWALRDMLCKHTGLKSND